jgi:HlyD family secretion protein
MIQLDDAAIQATLSEAQAAARAAQSNLDQVKEKARAPTVAIAEAGVAQADADWQAARAARESANRTLKTPQELSSQLRIWEGKVVAAQGDLKRAEAARGLAKSQMETAIGDQSMLGKTRLAMLQRQQDAADASIAAAQTTLNASKRIVELYKQMLDQPLELLLAQHSAENQVKVAEAGLKIAQAERDIATRDAQKETLALAEAKLRAAQANLGIVQAQATRHALIAPVDGKVVGRSGEVGETIRAGVPLVTLADTRELEMTVYVPIRNLGAIRVGQAATLQVPSIAGKSFAAKVTYIAPEAEFKPANIYNSKERSEMVFAVRVTVPNPNDELKAGLPADVTVE